MNKLLLLVVISAGTIMAAPCGPYADFTSSTGATNLSSAMNGKANRQCGTGAPTALAGTAGIDDYVDTATGNHWVVTVSGNPATWVQTGWPNAVQTTGSYPNPAWITSLAWSKLTGVPTFLTPANNLSDLANAATARTNLGLGTLATATLFNPVAALWTGANCGITTNAMLINGSCGSITAAVAPMDTAFTSTTVLTIGGVCTVGTPCHLRVGSIVYTFTSSSTLTASGSGSGTVYIYLSNSGVLTAGELNGTSPTMVGSGITVVTGITAFPFDSIPLAIWTAASGLWSSTGIDSRSILSGSYSFTQGSGITLTQSGSNVTITANAASTTACAPNDITCYSSTHYYAPFGFTNGFGWNYSANCVAATATPPTAESLLTSIGAQAPIGSFCVFTGPGLFDSLSGTTPSKLYDSVIYQSQDANGTQYIGLVSSSTGVISAPTTFIGCRAVNAGNWFAVIINAGTVVASADTGVARDNNIHHFVVDNNNGVANSIRCAIDGGTAAVASGTVPVIAGSFLWQQFVGDVAGGTASNFTVEENNIWLRSLSRI